MDLSSDQIRNDYVSVVLSDALVRLMSFGSAFFDIVFGMPCYEPGPLNQLLRKNSGLLSQLYSGSH